MSGHLTSAFSGHEIKEGQLSYISSSLLTQSPFQHSKPVLHFEGVANTFLYAQEYELIFNKSFVQVISVGQLFLEFIALNPSEQSTILSSSWHFIWL